MGYVYLNGSILSARDARVAVTDRGFRFGDGLFETVRVESGAPVFWQRHMARLRGGMMALGIEADISVLQPAAVDLLAASRLSDGLLRIAVSRGGGSRGYLPTHEEPPTLVIEALPPRPAPEQLTLWLSDWKRPPADVLPAQWKLAQGLNSTLARREAEAQGCGEALMLDIRGMLCEASAANLFFFREGRWHTPALGHGALAGVVRAVLRASAEVVEGEYPLEELRSASEVALTNAAWGVVPVASLAPQGWEWTARDRTRALRRVLSEAAARDAVEWHA